MYNALAAETSREESADDMSIVSSVLASPVREMVNREHSSSITSFSEVDAASKHSTNIEVNKFDSAKHKRYDWMDPRDPGLAEIALNAASTQLQTLEEVCDHSNGP